MKAFPFHEFVQEFEDGCVADFGLHFFDCLPDLSNG
jgi:hypothetical protein